MWVGVDGRIRFAAEIKTKSPVETSAGSKMVTLQIAGKLTGPPGRTAKPSRFAFSCRHKTPVSGFPFRFNRGIKRTLVSPDREKRGIGDGPASDNQLEVMQKILEIVQLEDDWALARGALSMAKWSSSAGLIESLPDSR